MDLAHLDSLVSAVAPINGVTLNLDGSFTLSYPPGVTPTTGQASAAAAVLAAWPLTSAQETQSTFTGVLSSPITLLADSTSEGIIVSRYANCKALRDANAITSTTLIGSVMSAVTDSSGVLHNMSIMTFMSVAASFVNSLATVRGYKDAQLAAIAAAPDVPTVQAVTWMTPTLSASVNLSAGYNNFLAQVAAAPITGTAVVDFGSTPTEATASVSVALASITSGSQIIPAIMADSTTATNRAQDHYLAGQWVALTVMRNAGVGFTINADPQNGNWTGQLVVNWVVG